MKTGIGKPITNAKRVVELADKRKAIYHVRWGRPIAAAWLASMQVRLIVGFIRMHWLYEYRAKRKVKSAPKRRLSHKG